MSKNSFKKYASEKYVDDKLLELSGQVGGGADWNQDDSSAKDYIKNRTHYDTRRIEEVDNGFNFTFDGSLEGKEYFELIPNVLYLVKMSDTPLSKEQIIGSNIKWANEEMAFTITEDSGILDMGSYLDINSTFSVFEECEVMTKIVTPGLWTDYNVELNKYTEYISKTIIETVERGELKQLDEKFLPEHSWNNLKDKPFGEEEKETVLFDDSNAYVEFYAMGTGESTYSIRPEIALVTGETYIFSVDGVKATGVCEQQHGVKFINFDINGNSWQVRESSVIAYINMQSITCHLKLISSAITVYTLDEKFIPDTIARVDYVDNAITNLVGLAPEARNTIEELATAIAEHEDVTAALDSAITNKVDKVEGKGLSTNDFTDELKTKYDEMCENHNIFDGIYLRDIENGLLYLVQMKGGTLVSSSRTVSIQISKEPDKMIYEDGEAFDPTGMIVSTTCDDGTQKILTNYTCSDIVDSVVTITYTEVGTDYTVQLNVLVREIVSIQVDQMPTKTEYLENEEFDPTGMVVSVVYNDGTVKEVSNYTYSDIVDSVVTITYEENGNTFTTEVKVSNPLVDFEYTTNEDGTYTLTGWKQTLNGEPSTEMVFPDMAAIIM